MLQLKGTPQTNEEKQVYNAIQQTFDRLDKTHYQSKIHFKRHNSSRVIATVEFEKFTPVIGNGTEAQPEKTATETKYEFISHLNPTLPGKYDYKLEDGTTFIFYKTI